MNEFVPQEFIFLEEIKKGELTVFFQGDFWRTEADSAPVHLTLSIYPLLSGQCGAGNKAKLLQLSCAKNLKVWNILKPAPYCQDGALILPTVKPKVRWCFLELIDFLGVRALSSTVSTPCSLKFFLPLPPSFLYFIKTLDFPDGPVVKNLPSNAGGTSLIPGPRRSQMPQSN